MSLQADLYFCVRPMPELLNCMLCIGFHTSASLSIKYKNNKLGLIPFISYYETVVLEFAKLVFAKLVHIQSTQFMIIKKTIQL